MQKENNVILAILKLSRAMRRCPPPRAEHPFPPAIGRLLECVAENSNVSSRDLCEILDLRPSSLSEMLARAESAGWIIRSTDEEDRRIQRVRLSEKGTELVARTVAVREADLEKKTACFTEEEKAQFCALCNKLSDHIESLASDVPAPFRRPPEDGFPDDEPPEGCPRPGSPRHPFPPGSRMRC